MLVNLDFDMSTFNSDNGVNYVKEHDATNPEMITIIGTCDHNHEFWKSSYDEPTAIDHILQESTGVYLVSSLNFEYTIQDNTTNELLDHGYGMFNPITGEYTADRDKTLQMMKDGIKLFVGYGVCDNYDQVLQKYPFIESTDNKYVLVMSPIFKKHQPEDGGWRWHKWGDYIGTHDIQHEYLYDEEGIEHVFLFHLYALK